MKKKIISIVVAVLVSVCFVGTSLAMETGNKRKGKYTYREFAEFGCQEEWSSVSDKDLVDIFTYLYEHGSDSPTPAKCK